MIHATQQLEHGKLLTKNNFPNFVETFNRAVTRIDKIKGDRDIDPQNGHITVDNTDDDRPIIRYVGDVNKSSDIMPDTDVTSEQSNPQKSIEINQLSSEDDSGVIPYLQLYNFHLSDDYITTTLTLDSLSGNYNLNSEDEQFLVRKNGILRYKTIELETRLSGGGGGDLGLTQDISVVTGSTYDTSSHKLLNHISQLSFRGGLLVSVTPLTDTEVFEAVRHSDCLPTT